MRGLTRSFENKNWESNLNFRSVLGQWSAQSLGYLWLSQITPLKLRKKSWIRINAWFLERFISIPIHKRINDDNEV